MLAGLLGSGPQTKGSVHVRWLRSPSRKYSVEEEESEVPNLSVVIPSKSMANLVPCVRAVKENEPDARVIVVDDFDITPTRELFQDCGLDLSDDLIVDGASPFCFARNVNRGIAAAGIDDVILLNDDAILKTKGGFSRMQWDAESMPNVGLVSATTNVAGNPEQHPRHPPGREPGMRIAGICPGNSFPSVAFVCVLLPRRIIDALRKLETTLPQQIEGQGPLDERFLAYGWEDNDCCRRLKILGKSIGIHDGCYVDHGSLHSTFRGQAYASGSIQDGRTIYMKKWGSV